MLTRKLFSFRTGSLLFFLLFIIRAAFASDTIPDRIKIRLFSDRESNLVFFTAASGRYSVVIFPCCTEELNAGETALMMRYNGRLALKIQGKKALLADSVCFRETTSNNKFILSNSTGDNKVYLYSGNLFCRPDLETIVLVNDCNIEEYIAGVVRTEGGPGRNAEFFKTQAVLARTYTYRNLGRHTADGYNLCDATHCQAFNGITGESVIHGAVYDTRGKVIVTPDSNLIISAFHSNCGGQTSSSGYVWMLSLPYLKGVTDPYCTGSRNAVWEKKVDLDDWKRVLAANGYAGNSKNASGFSFTQTSRMMSYTTGTFSIPFNVLRNLLGLRSAWFSVVPSGDSLLLKGRGYGHGVGLCQEGAMVMADKGFTSDQIIKFYYPGVQLINIEFARKAVELKK